MSGFWTGRTALVTGAGGFTGSRLTARLASEGASVRAFVRRGGSRREFPEQVDVWEGDLTEATDCREAVQGIDTVFHVAAVFRQVAGNRAGLEAIHVRATEHLIRAGKQSACRRFVHTSTMGVHGHVSHGPGNEQSPFNPGDDYQETKVEGERLAFRLAGELGLPLTVVRPCGIYGPGDRRFLKLVRPIASGRFVMVGAGNAHYHFVFIDDLVQGYLLAGEKEQAVGQAFLIGGTECPTLNELAAMIAKILEVPPPRLRLPVWPVYAAGWTCERLCNLIGVEPPLHPRRVAFFTKNREFRIDKARDVLGYEPRTSVEKGFRHMISWYGDNDLL